MKKRKLKKAVAPKSNPAELHYYAKMDNHQEQHIIIAYCCRDMI